jgi:hypothetical protein
MNTKLPLYTFLFLVLFCLSVSIGCKPASKSGTKPAKLEEIEETNISWILRRENNIENIDFIFGDSKYVIVDENWFVEKVLFGFEQFLFDNGIQNYSLRNDCDDFARAFSFYCRVKYRELGYMKSSPAVGDFYYKWSDGDPNSLLNNGHAINVGIFFNSAGEKVVRFIEPQKPNKLYDISFIDEEIRRYYVEHVGF